MRTINDIEYAFMALVENATLKNLHQKGLSETAIVEEMDDGGMGSLLFVAPDNMTTKRRLGSVFAEGEFTDADGVLVKFSVNLDTDEQLYELDIWRVDFEPLCQFPASSKKLKIYPVAA